MAQHFHIETPNYVNEGFRIEPTLTRAARYAKMVRIERLNRKFAALSNANKKAMDIKRDIEREVKNINF